MQHGPEFTWKLTRRLTIEPRPKRPHGALTLQLHRRLHVSTPQRVRAHTAAHEPTVAVLLGINTKKTTTN